MARINDQVSGAVSTSGLETKVIKNYAVPDNSNGRVSATVNAWKSDGTSAVWEYRVAVKRVNAGNVTIIGTPVDLLGQQGKDAGAATWLPSFAVNGTSLELKGTGALLTDIDWSASIRLEIFVP